MMFSLMRRLKLLLRPQRCLESRLTRQPWSQLEAETVQLVSSSWLAERVMKRAGIAPMQKHCCQALSFLYVSRKEARGCRHCRISRELDAIVLKPRAWALRTRVDLPHGDHTPVHAGIGHIRIPKSLPLTPRMIPGWCEPADFAMQGFCQATSPRVSSSGISTLLTSSSRHAPTSSVQFQLHWALRACRQDSLFSARLLIESKSSSPFVQDVVSYEAAKR